MTEKRKLNPFDKLVFISYLLVQDRIGEAKNLFGTIDSAPFESQAPCMLKIQFNYMKAYFDFYEGQKTGFKIAKAICNHYKDYPVITWRMKFLEILDQLKEVAGEASDDEMEEDTEHPKKKEEEKKDNKKMMSFDLDETEKTITVKYDNV